MKFLMKTYFTPFVVFLVCFMHISAPSIGQTMPPRFKIAGTLIDARTAKPLKKIPIYVLPFKKTIDTNNEGRFLFDMPQGTYNFEIDYYPYEKKNIKIDLISDTSVVIKLYSPFVLQYIDELEVLANKQQTETPSSIDRMDRIEFIKIPAFVGEKDIIKGLQLSSGVTSSSEGAADLQVRGGNTGQNLYLLDGVPLYATQHFFGMVSVYNPLIIKNVKLYKAAFPAEYGGKVSSVVDVSTQDANLKKWSCETEISMLTTKLRLNIPLLKNKVACAISGRVSNYGGINLLSIGSIKQKDKLKMNFYDINANLLWNINENNNVRLNYFTNRENLNSFQLDRTSFSNVWIKNSQQNVGIKWNLKMSEKLSNELSAFADRYLFDFGQNQIDTVYKYKTINQLLSGINSYGLIEKFNIRNNDKLIFILGGSFKIVGFSPVILNQSDTTFNKINFNNQSTNFESSIFAESDLSFSLTHKLKTGFRFSAFGNNDNMFKFVEPRLSYHGIFENNYSVSSSISFMTQPIHRVANPGLGFMFELFLPSGNDLLPQKSWNYSLGAAKDITLENSKLSIKADAWYKSFTNIAEFKDGYDVLTTVIFKKGITNNNIDIITQGKGYAYGIDFSSFYSRKRFSLTAVYTCMKAMSKFSELNNGNWFPSSTDIRHSLSLLGEYKLSPSWIINASWQFNSGKPITVPTYVLALPSYNESNDELETSTPNYQFLETERNNYRMKAFHKLDISLLHTYKAFRKYDASLSLGLYNVYNRANPYLYFVAEERNESGVYLPVLKSMSIFPILPSFSWSMRF